jgi:hypothetical protein
VDARPNKAPEDTAACECAQNAAGFAKAPSAAEPFSVPTSVRLTSRDEPRRVSARFAPSAPPTLLVFGAAFQCEHCTPPEWQNRVQHLWAIDVINALTIVQIASSVVIVWIASGTRSLSAAIQTLFLWCSFWTGFISAMSISGDWL